MNCGMMTPRSDLVGQLLALLEGFGNFDECVVAPAVAREFDPCVGAADLVATEQVGPELHLSRRRPRIIWRQRQVVVAGDEFAAHSEHHVIDGVARIRTQHLARGHRQLQNDLAASFAQVGGQHADGIRQTAVKRCIRDALGDDVGHRDAQRPQEQQRREHPVEDFAEQRALLKLRAQRVLQAARPLRRLGRGLCIRRDRVSSRARAGAASGYPLQASAVRLQTLPAASAAGSAKRSR